jgi:hypothetical protein
MKNKKNSVVSKMPISSSNMNPVQLLLFSSVFLGIGLYIICISLKLVSFEGRINAPLEIVFLCGATFFLGGISAFTQGLSRYKKLKTKERLYRSHQNQPWIWDYQWSRKGISNRSKNSLLNHFIGLSITLCFLGVTYWIGFILKDGFKVPFYGMCVFCTFILMWFYTMISKKIRYGRAFLKFSQFPSFLGKRLDIQFQNIPPKDKVSGITVTIRCYEEIFTQNVKKQNMISLKELYQDSVELRSSQISTDRTLEASFMLPLDNTLSSALSESPARFWEAQIECDIKGLDYREYFLLPIYRK